MDQTLWTGVTDRLAEHARCVVPVLPLGGHRRPMNPDADVSLHGQADLLGEFIAHLDLHDVMLVGVDWGGPQLTAVRHPERLAGLVLLSQEAFDNIPPGLPGAVRGLRRSHARRVVHGGADPARRVPEPAAHHVGPDGQAADPSGGQQQLGPRPPDEPRRAAGHLRYITTSDNDGLKEAARLLADFELPTLVLWGSEETLMPIEHGRRLAEIVPNPATSRSTTASP